MESVQLRLSPDQHVFLYVTHTAHGFKIEVIIDAQRACGTTLILRRPERSVKKFRNGTVRTSELLSIFTGAT